MDQSFWVWNYFITLVEDIAKYLRCQQNIILKREENLEKIYKQAIKLVFNFTDDFILQYIN